MLELAGCDQHQRRRRDIACCSQACRSSARHRRGCVSSSPSTDRPSGCSGKAASCRWSNTRSDAVSRASASSCSDDLLLELEMRRLEMRPADEVREQSTPSARSRRQQARVEGGQLAVGRGVEIAADILDQLADLARRAAARALEHHMLEQMRDAVERRRLVARSGRAHRGRRRSSRRSASAGWRRAARWQGSSAHHCAVALRFSRLRIARP